MFYIGDDIRVTMEVNEVLTPTCTAVVCYVKPHSTEIVEKQPSAIMVATSRVVYDLPKEDNNVAGTWRFWVRVINDDLKEASSTGVSLSINKH